MEERKKIKGEYREIPIEKITPNLWNPNQMDEKEFNQLVRNMQELPGAVPITVVEKKDGTFMIIGGEHRWKSARLTGEQVMGAMVYKEEDVSEDYAKFQTMRLNVIHGKVNPQKFVELYQSLSSKYAEDALKDMMGFVNQAEWDKLLAKVRSGLPNKNLKERFDQVKEKIKTVQDLSTILNQLFTKYGSTLPYSFMVFDFGGKENLWIRVGKPLYSTLKMAANECVGKEVTMDSFLNDVLIAALNRKEEVNEIFTRLPKVQFKKDMQWPSEAEKVEN